LLARASESTGAVPGRYPVVGPGGVSDFPGGWSASHPHRTAGGCPDLWRRMAGELASAWSQRLGGDRRCSRSLAHARRAAGLGSVRSPLAAPAGAAAYHPLRPPPLLARMVAEG